MSYFYGQNLHLSENHTNSSGINYPDLGMIPRTEDGAQFPLRSYQGSVSLVAPAYSWSVTPSYALRSDVSYGSQSHANEDGRCRKRRLPTIAQRRAANVRERRRMFNLNEAFDSLRRRVPTFAYEKRLSRIETLRLAISYISFMSDILNGKNPNEIKMNVFRNPVCYGNSLRETNSFPEGKDIEGDMSDECAAEDSNLTNGKESNSEYDSTGDELIK